MANNGGTTSKCLGSDFCEVKREDLLVIVSMQNKAPVKKKSYCFKMSNEKKPGWLDYIGDYTTHLYRDYDKPL